MNTDADTYQFVFYINSKKINCGPVLLFMVNLLIVGADEAKSHKKREQNLNNTIGYRPLLGTSNLFKCHGRIATLEVTVNVIQLEKHFTA